MKHYMDIVRIKQGDEELTEDNTKCFEIGDRVIIQEKIDGANASFTLGDDGQLIAFSRKNELTATNNLRGYWNFIQTLNAEEYTDLQDKICFAEWLIPHTVVYDKEAYKQVYVFDLYDKQNEKWLPQDEVKTFAEKHGLNYIHTLYDGPFVSWDHVKSFCNSPAYGERQEGVVIKNQTKLNDPDVRQPFYLKIVNDSFKETQLKNHVKKVLDPQHVKEKQEADESAEQLVTKARVLKEIHKMIDEGILPEKLQPKDMGVIAKNLPKRIFDDVVKEESEYLDIGNQYIGKAINNITMKYAREIVTGE